MFHFKIHHTKSCKTQNMKTNLIWTNVSQNSAIRWQMYFWPPHHMETSHSALAAKGWLHVSYHLLLFDYRGDLSDCQLLRWVSLRLHDPGKKPFFPLVLSCLTNLSIYFAMCKYLTFINRWERNFTYFTVSAPFECSVIDVPSKGWRRMATKRREILFGQRLIKANRKWLGKANTTAAQEVPAFDLGSEKVRRNIFLSSAFSSYEWSLSLSSTVLSFSQQLEWNEMEHSLKLTFGMYKYWHDFRTTRINLAM